MKSSFSIFFLICLLLVLAHQQCKPDDPSCSTCSYASIIINNRNFIFAICSKCALNRTLDQRTNMCYCDNSYYPTSTTTCAKCPQTCYTCESETRCLSCYPEYNRVLSDGVCVCNAGFESKNGDALCKEKPSTLMIVLSSIGSAICMMLSFVGCAFLRMRGSHQIHAENKKRRNNSFEVREEMSVPEGMENVRVDNDFVDENTSGMFWNARNFIYREGEICSICLDTNPLFMTECEHYFHSKCIYSWFKNKKTCPNCNNETDQKNVKRWCSRCKNVVMPVIMNISISRPSKKSKKDNIVQTPLQIQFCQVCENQMIMEVNEKNLIHQDHNVLEKQPESNDGMEIWK